MQPTNLDVVVAGIENAHLAPCCLCYRHILELHNRLGGERSHDDDGGLASFGALLLL